MTEDEIIAVVQACKDGKRIERRSHAQFSTDWKLICGHPMWNFADFDYRVVEPKWRDATIDDLKRAPLPCRVMDHDDDRGWANSTLIGYRAAGPYKWIDNNNYPWRYCQVLDDK